MRRTPLIISLLLIITIGESEAQTNTLLKKTTDSIRVSKDSAMNSAINSVQAESLRLRQFSTQLEKTFRQHFIGLTQNESPDAVLEKFQGLPAGSYLFKSKARNEMETIVDSMVLCKRRFDSLTSKPERLLSADEKLDDIQEFAEFLQDAINRGEIAERSRLDRIIENVDYDERSYQSALRKAKTEEEVNRITDERIASLRMQTRAELNKLLLKSAFGEATRLVTLRFYERIGKGIPQDTLKLR